MIATTVYNIDKRDLDAFLDEFKKNILDHSKDYGTEIVFAWLSAIKVTTPTVCEILRISSQTLTNWVKADRLRVINEGCKPHEYDLSEVIKLYLTKNKLL